MRVNKWEDLPKFVHPEDVPELPLVNKQEWDDFYIPKLIEAGAIPKKELEVGEYYAGKHRRARAAKWTGQHFIYNRDKFNIVYQDRCNHFEDDDGKALFVPIRLASQEEYDKNIFIY
jgi:hypothetical protein